MSEQRKKHDSRRCLAPSLPVLDPVQSPSAQVEHPFMYLQKVTAKWRTQPRYSADTFPPKFIYLVNMSTDSFKKKPCSIF